MSFRFLPDDKSAAAAVQRIARQEIVTALAEMADQGQPFDARVHGARRRCKRLRGLARLVRPQFDGYAHTNAAVREAMARLAHTRDAAVIVETLDSLAETDPSDVSGEALKRVRQVLSARVEEISADEKQRLIADFTERLRVLAEEAEAWRLGKKGFAAIEGGLTRVYAGMGEAMREARAAPDDEALHEWRKHVKYHWHHITLMREAAPDVLGPQRALADELGEALGDHHNLSVLIGALPQVTGEGDREGITAAARRKQERLAARAFELGRQVAAESPRALARRFSGYWKLLYG
jgi:CHAD domain-containing protein